MAIQRTGNEIVKKQFMNFYGFGNFIVYPKINLTNKEKKELGIKVNEEYNQLTQKNEEVEISYIRPATTKFDGDIRLETPIKKGYDEVQLQFYLQLRNPDKHAVNIPMIKDEKDVREAMKNTWLMYDIIVGNTETPMYNGKKAGTFWVDGRGKYGYAVTPEELENEGKYSAEGFDSNSHHRALLGETNMLDFLNTVIALRGGVSIDMKKVFQEDYSEIEEVLYEAQEKQLNADGQKVETTSMKGITGLITIKSRNNKEKDTTYHQMVLYNRFAVGSVDSKEGLQKSITQHLQKDVASGFRKDLWYGGKGSGLWVLTNELNTINPAEIDTAVKKMNSVEAPF